MNLDKEADMLPPFKENIKFCLVLIYQLHCRSWCTLWQQYKLLYCHIVIMVNEIQKRKGNVMNRSILVISPRDNISRVIADNIMNSFTGVFCAHTSIQAIEMVMRNVYNLIILDSLMQDMAVGTLLRIIRQTSNSPILVLTREIEMEDRIKILNLGADDSIVWPVNVDELIVRVEACMKRGINQFPLKNVIIQQISLVINPSRRTVEIKGSQIKLTRREFDILYLLASNQGVVFSKEQIYAIIWDDKYVKDDSNIMSHIGRLRKKMGEAGKYIQTVWGIGYRFADGEQVEE